MKLTLLSIRKNDIFNKLYIKFIKKENFTDYDLRTLLIIVIIMLNSEDVNINKFAYKIIVNYSNYYKDYSLLYEVAINNGLFPIAKAIDQHLSGSNGNLYTEIASIYMEQIKSKNNHYNSAGQLEMNKKYIEKMSESYIAIAPTSYGKSELMIESINEKENTCIITPTKSLLSQTKKRIIDTEKIHNRKIITHPEMFNDKDQPCLAVLTQERLFRLLKNKPNLSFDTIIIDEAHELLTKDYREVILAILLIVLKRRNPNAKFKFLTPFLVRSDSLKLRYHNIEFSSHKIDEYIKTEKIFIYEPFNNKKLIYDQFIDKFIEIDDGTHYLSDIDYLEKNSSHKNIVYFNKPVDIERFANEMIKILPDIEISDKLSKAITHITECTHKEYLLAKCLRKGFIYHHGSVPDSIKPYIEHLYRTIPEIKYVLTSSTLLEGVNIPATRIFIMDICKGRAILTRSMFKNLIGRVCRFSEIFDNNINSLEYLEPQVHFVLGDRFSYKTTIEKNVRNFMKIDKAEKDKTDNVLLENTKITEDNKDQLERTKEIIKNYDSEAIPELSVKEVNTKIGKSCIMNGLYEINVLFVEKKMEDKINDLMKEINFKIDNINTLLDIISKVFIPFVEDNQRNQNILRLRNKEALNYYAYFLTLVLKGDPYNRMIERTYTYWKNKSSDDDLIYVGKWGDISYKNTGKYYTRVSTKNDSELVNLAIVRVKEEQDFVSYNIMKFIEVLNDLDFIDNSLYNQLKYGINNQDGIVMVMNGISLGLTKLLLDKYSNYIKIDYVNEIVEFNNDLIKIMEESNENDILIFELKQNIPNL